MINISSMVDFANGSMIIALIVRTIYLIRKNIKYTFMTDDEYEELEKHVQELEEELDNKTWQINIIYPGIRDWIYGFLNWQEEHRVLNNIIVYLLCLVPIINLVLTLYNLKSIFEE